MTATLTAAAPQTVLLVDAGAPASVSTNGSLLLVSPDQPLTAAVAYVLALVPTADAADVRGWIASGTFPAERPGGTR